MHLNTKQCPCGEHEFTVKDIIPPLMNQAEALQRKHDPDLFGGNVKKFSKALCPDCGKEVLLWLKPHDNSWKVITISTAEESEPANPFDSMDRNALREWLDEREVKYHSQLGEVKLRELAKQTSEEEKFNV